MAYATADGLWVPHAVSELPLDIFPTEITGGFLKYGGITARLLQQEGERVERARHIQPFIPGLQGLVAARLNEPVDPCAVCDGRRTVELKGDTVGIGDFRASFLRLVCDGAVVYETDSDALRAESVCQTAHRCLAQTVLRHAGLQTEVLESLILEADHATRVATEARERVMQTLRSGVMAIVPDSLPAHLSPTAA